MPAAPLILRALRWVVAATALGLLAVMLVLANAIVHGRFAEGRCDAAGDGTHIEHQLVPPELRCLGGASGERVLDDATTEARVLLATTASLSIAVVVVAIRLGRPVLRRSRADWIDWRADFP